MATWHLRDDGVPIPLAASISGIIPAGAFKILLDRGHLSYPGLSSSEFRQRATLLEVAAARSLVEAEMSGVAREDALPFIMQIAEAALLQYAMIELSRRSYQSRGVPGGVIAEFAQRLHSEEGCTELQERLGLRGRHDPNKVFATFEDGGLQFRDAPPASGRQFVNARNVAQQIKNYSSSNLLYGTYEASRLVA